MAVIPSFVQVAADGPGKKIDNVEVTTSQGVVERQVTVQGDPEDPNARGAVKAALPASGAYGVVVRVAPPDVDTGNVAVTTTLTAVVGATCKGKTLLITSLVSHLAYFSLQDGVGAIYAQERPIQPNDFVVIPLGDVQFASGVKWQASVDGELRAQFVGALV